MTPYYCALISTTGDNKPLFRAIRPTMAEAASEILSAMQTLGFDAKSSAVNSVMHGLMVVHGERTFQLIRWTSPEIPEDVPLVTK